MNILLLGSGGREHAFAWKLTQSSQCTKLFIAPGNAGTSQLGENVNINPNDFEVVKQFVLENKVKMVVVGPEEPLVLGIYDFFKNDPELKKIAIIGPSKEGAKLEGSKAFAKRFMQRHGVPTAAYKEFTKETLAEGLDYLAHHTTPIVLKADGLAAGKGVLICQSIKEAQTELKAMLGGKFGAASEKVVVEQFLDGIEFSVFALTDGRDYKILPVAKDYKRVGEGDKGLNTGGMGAISHPPFVTTTLMRKVEKNIIKPTIRGLNDERIAYEGFVFFGLILVQDEPFVIEYNCRMGDPETEVVLPRLQSDLVRMFKYLSKGELINATIKMDKQAAATVMLVSGGYPGDYEKGKVIKNLDKVKDSLVFHAGTKSVDDQVVTNGGRVISITSFGETFQEAIAKSNKAAKLIDFEGKYFRKDIGFDL